MTIHMCVSVRGAILRLSRSRAKWAEMETTDDGRPMTRLDALDAYMEHLAQGHEVIPCGEPCEGFDWKTGCPGHKTEAEMDAAEAREAARRAT